MLNLEFKYWLSEQKYAMFRPYFNSPSYWMIYDVKVKVYKTRQIIEYNWEEIISYE